MIVICRPINSIPFEVKAELPVLTKPLAGDKSRHRALNLKHPFQYIESVNLLQGQDSVA